ncbi:MAG: glycosyltransferase family 4 protein, partial [Acidobacteriota bacterium]
ERGRAPRRMPGMACLITPNHGAPFRELRRTSMRVLLIEPAGRRGMIHYAYCLANALVASGHHVILLTALEHETRDLPRAFEVREVFQRFVTDPIRLAREFRRLNRVGVEIVHLHGAIHPELYLPLLWFIRTFLGKRVVYTAHDILPDKNRLGRWRPIKKCLVRLTGALYDAVGGIIVHSPQDRAALVQRFRLPKEKVTVCPHGNYLFLGSVHHGPEPAVPNGQKAILFFGVIVPSKGLSVLLRAFAKVVAELPEARLVIAGQPFEDPAPYLDEIRRLEIEPWTTVDFRYIPLSEVPSFFLRAHVVVLPYLSASQSGVIQVAYAFARPVIATKCGGLEDVVEHERSGLLVAPDDPNELATAITRVLDDDERRLEMGEWARHLAEVKYSWKRIATLTEGVYGHFA